MYGRAHGYHLHWRPDREALDKLLKEIPDQIHDDYGNSNNDFVKLAASCHAYQNTEFPGQMVRNGSAHFQVRGSMQLSDYSISSHS